MFRYFGTLCVAGSVLLGGCRTEYLAESNALTQARRAADRLDREGRDQTVAVQVLPVDPEASSQPPRYVRYSALRIDKMRPDAPWRVSAPDRGSFLTAGSILLGIGLASIVAGAFISRPSPCTMCTSDERDAHSIGSGIFGGAFIGGGILEVIPGAIMLGMGAQRVEIPSGARGVLYLPESPVQGSAEALPAGYGGLHAGLRF